MTTKRLPTAPPRSRAHTMPGPLDALVPFLTALMLLGGPVQAAAPALYHSPADDGVSGGLPATVPSGPSVTLHLYLGIGSNVSTADPCSQGDGDEVCGYLIRLAGTDLDLLSFTPAGPDLLFNLTPGQIDLTGGDYQNGEIGPTKLGDLVFDAPLPGGAVDLLLGDFVTTTLTKEQAAAPMTIATVPEPGGIAALSFGCALLTVLGRRRLELRPIHISLDRGDR